MPSIGFDKGINNQIQLALLASEYTGVLTFDKSKNHMPFTLTGTPPAWAKTAQGMPYLSLNGAADYLQCPAASSSAVNFTSSDFTLLAWIYSTGTSSDMIMCQGAVDVDGWEWYIFQGGVGTASINLRTNQAAAHTGTGTATEILTLDRWHQLVTVRWGIWCQHYIDGVAVPMLVGSLTNPVSVAAGNKLLIGVQNNEVANHFQGYIGAGSCGPRIWSRALSPFEIKALFESERAWFGV